MQASTNEAEGVTIEDRMKYNKLVREQANVFWVSVSCKSHRSLCDLRDARRKA